METKIIKVKREIEETKTIYVANDGTEYDSECECRDHDAFMAIKNMPHKKLQLTGSRSDYQIWYYITNKDEFNYASRIERSSIKYNGQNLNEWYMFGIDIYDTDYCNNKTDEISQFLTNIEELKSLDKILENS